jgi:hypothetical protein
LQDSTYPEESSSMINERTGNNRMISLKRRQTYSQLMISGA